MFNPFNNAFTAAAFALIFTGCAASYTPIRPENITNYSTGIHREAVDLGYNVDALRARGGNKRYAKKEAKARYKVVALRVTNNTERELNFGQDIILFSGNQPANPVAPVAAAADMKQGVPIYLLYLLLNLNVGGKTEINPNTGQTVTTGGTFIPTGPFIAAGNMLGAAGANANFRKDLAKHDLTNRSIKPGSTVYGVVTLRDNEASALRLQMRESATQLIPAAPAPVAPSPNAADPTR